MCRYYDAPTSVLHSLIITVILVLQCVHNGAAIKCFVCDSSDNPSCADLKSNSSIVAEECTLEKMKSSDTWLFDLNSFAYFDTGIRDGPLMNCQKVVARDPHTSKIVTARFCQLDTADSDACQILGKRLGWPPELARNANANNNDNKNNNNAKRKLKYGNNGNNGGGGGADENQDAELHCSICDADNCNGSQSAHQWSSWWCVGVLPALIAWMISLRYHSAW
ncbi:probable serine/threonine-protein kinase DDB_G0280461 [Rhagoletis pomonella]|uniref:probable serine/threonine-protein kinase DDB_G0280461 n=1 Tax=Rhagoletis pomonella TaxID=28610 RepID=UPI0017863C0D|nr:probable serine/threonine-protein kinase DDB_G0280461 [Rhagoletis pomonella]